MSRIQYLMLLAAIVLMGAGLRLSGLNHESFWFNEAASYYYAKGTLAEVIRHSFVDETNPPGFHLLIHFWTRLAGTSEGALRLPNALAGTLTLVLMAGLGRHFLSRRGSLIAAALLACWPLHVWYSQECRAYAFWIFFILAAYLCFLNWLRSGKKRFLVLNGAAIFLAVSFHYFGFHVILVEQAWLLVARPRMIRKCWKSWFIAHGVLALCLIPFALMMLMVDRTNVAWWRESGVQWQAVKSLIFHLNGVYFLLTRELPVKASLLLANGVALIFGARALRRRGRLAFPLLALGLPVLVNLAYSLLASPILGNSQSAGRYFLLILPSYLMLLAAGWDWFIGHLRLPRRGWLALLALLFLCLWGVRASRVNTPFTRDDNRRLCGELLARVADSDLIVAAPYLTLDYYADRYGRNLQGFQIIKTSRFDKSVAERFPAEARRIWCYLDPIQHFGPLLAQLQRRYGMRVVMQKGEPRLSNARLVLLERDGKN